MSTPGPVGTSNCASAWHGRADALAKWAFARLVNRTNAYGGYRPDHEIGKKFRRSDGSEGSLGSQKTVKAPLTVARMVRHFRARGRADVIGLHAADADNRSKGGGLDIDHHGPGSTDPETNLAAALHWYGALAGQGFRPLLTESNGNGGYHLRVLLAGPVPADRVFWFLRQLTRDYRALGLESRPETFPKQSDVRKCKKGFGNWLRVIGRHHKRDHWSTVWDGSRWLSGDDAIDYLLALTVDPPTLIPADIEWQFRIGEYMATLPHLGEGQGRDDVAFNFLAFLARDLKLPDDYAVEWAARWDAGNRPPKGPERLREILASVHAYGQRDYGHGLNGPGLGHATGKAGELIDPLRRWEDSLGDGSNADAGPAAEADADPREDAHLTDVGNGLRFAAENAHDARYVPGWGWVVWDGTRWARDQMGRAYELAKATVRRMYSVAAEQVNAIAAELEAAGDDKQAKEELKGRNDRAMRALTWALKSEDAKRIEALLKMARTDPGIVTPVERFDADPFAFNVRNGTLDLRTAKLKPHDRADYITKLAPVEYDPKAAAPTWDRLLTGMWDGDPDLIRWNQRFAGYAATGDVREQVIAIFHGTGGNGKSTYVETLLDVLGDYAYKANAELLLAGKSDRHETEKAALAGRRFVAACETGEGRRMNEPLVKEATGGDRITARFCRQDHFTFGATFKVALSTNHRPEVRGTDAGIWRRVRLVPFNVRFWKPGETPGPEHLRADPQMRDKLRGELSGVLNWIVAGAVEWSVDGLGTCKAVEAATADYRSAEDVVSQWFDERCDRDTRAESKAGELFANYVSWAESRKEKPLTRTMFGTRLTAMGFTKRKSDGAMVYEGIRMNSQGG